MDKSTKRVIGWQPNKTPEVKKEVKPKIYTPKQDVETVEDDTESKKMATWIKDAVLINKSALCKESKIDRANLDKYLLKGEIPEQHIDTLKKALFKYGYV
jgi:hypothetical protein